MAEAADKQDSLGSKMFRETALRKMTTADDLDRYLQVTNPSAWILVGAVTVLLIVAFIWGLTASLPISQSTTGVLRDGQIVCFLPIDESAQATTDSKATAAGHETYIISVDDNPYSQREVSSVIGSDYAIASLNLSTWSYKVIIALPESIKSWEEGDDVPIQITTREIAPLAYLFGGNKS